MFLDFRLRQIRLTVQRKFMSEEIKRHANQLAAVARGDLVEQRNIRPELVYRGKLVELVVINVEKRTLFEIGQHHAPATPQVVDGTKGEIGFERFFVDAFAKFRQV